MRWGRRIVAQPSDGKALRVQGSCSFQDDGLRQSKDRDSLTWKGRPLRQASFGISRFMRTGKGKLPSGPKPSGERLGLCATTGPTCAMKSSMEYETLPSEPPPIGSPWVFDAKSSSPSKAVRDGHARSSRVGWSALTAFLDLSRHIRSRTTTGVRLGLPTQPKVSSAPALYSEVELLTSEGGWPAGTRGTVIETYPTVALVEIADDDDLDVDSVVVPYGRLACPISSA